MRLQSAPYCLPPSFRFFNFRSRSRPRSMFLLSFLISAVFTAFIRHNQLPLLCFFTRYITPDISMAAGFSQEEGIIHGGNFFFVEKSTGGVYFPAMNLIIRIITAATVTHGGIFRAVISMTASGTITISHKSLTREAPIGSIFSFIPPFCFSAPLLSASVSFIPLSRIPAYPSRTLQVQF